MPPIYQSSQNSISLSPPPGGTITPDATQNAQYLVTLPAGNITIANPTNPAVGQSITFVFTQDAVGGRTVTWGSALTTSAQPAPGPNAMSQVTLQFNGTTWSSIPNVSALGTGDPFLAYTSTPPTPYASLYTAQSGTGASPDTTDAPVVHIARRISLTSGAETGDGNYAAAALSVDIGGNATNLVQPIAVRGTAKTISTAASVGALSADASGGYFVGYASAASTHLGIGLFALGRTDSSAAGAQGRISGVQIGAENITSNDATVLASAFSGGAVWITAANSKSKVATAIEVGNSGGGNTPGAKGGLFDVGLHFNSQVANGNTGAIDTASIQDDSSAKTSVLINGAHATAAVAIASGSGPLLVGATARNQASALVEVATGATTADPLVNLYATTGAFSVRFANNSGNAKLALSAGPSNFIAGSASGDLILQSSSAGNRVLLGGTSIVLSATFANTLGFFGATEVAQQNTTGTATGFTANVGTAVQDASTFTGGTGTTAYRISDVVRALKSYGLLAA